MYFSSVKPQNIAITYPFLIPICQGWRGGPAPCPIAGGVAPGFPLRRKTCALEELHTVSLPEDTWDLKLPEAVICFRAWLGVLSAPQKSPQLHGGTVSASHGIYLCFSMVFFFFFPSLVFSFLIKNYYNSIFQDHIPVYGNETSGL